MPKSERMVIYEHLFKEGVMVAKKDFHAPKHPELETIQNLHVIKTMQVSLIILVNSVICMLLYGSRYLISTYL